MNTNLISFNYNNSQVRTAIDQDGNPLICLADVCKILDSSQPNKVAEAIREEFGCTELNSAHVTDSLGRDQEATFITEPQLYFVLYRSRSDKAKPFRRWVDTEVLPSIRKTGEYKMNQEEKTAEEEAFAEYKKVDLEKVGGALKDLLSSTVPTSSKRLVLANNFINKCLNLDLLDIAQYKPISADPIKDNIPRYTPTELGKPYGLSAQKINKLLEKAGLQFKEDTGWVPTEEGKLQGGVLLNLNGHVATSSSVSQLKWPITVINLIFTDSEN